MGSEDQRRHSAVTSQNGCLKTWSESRGKYEIALDGKDWYEILYFVLICAQNFTLTFELQLLLCLVLFCRLRNLYPFPYVYKPAT